MDTYKKWERCSLIAVISSLIISSLAQNDSTVAELLAGVDITGGISDLAKSTSSDGVVFFVPTPNEKGTFFFTAYSQVLRVNKTKAAALLANKNKGAISRGVALIKQQETGKNVWTDSLNPVLGYYGGAVLSQLGPKRPFLINIIYYGSKWTSYQKYIVENFINSLDPKVRTKDPAARTLSNWWAITTRYYYDAKKRNITQNVRLNAVFNDKGSALPKGTSKNVLNRADLKAIVSNAMEKKFGLPNTRTAFLVLTDENTHVSRFCHNICTFHTSFRYRGRTAVYLFAGNPSVQCPYLCTFKFFESRYKAANDFGIDSLLNWVAHDLTAIATDTLFGRHAPPGWVVLGTSIENADFCYYDFGYFGFTKTYAFWNVKGLGDMRFFIQRNWNVALQACTMTASGKLDTPLPLTPS